MRRVFARLVILIAIMSTVLMLGCTNALLVHPQIQKEYQFKEPGVAVVYGKITPPPVTKEFYLTFANKTSAARPLRGGDNNYFAVRLKPGFYRLFVSNSENPLLNQSAPIFDRSNGVNEGAPTYRFKEGKIYYLGNIQLTENGITVDSNKDQDDIWMSNNYKNFIRERTEEYKYQ